MEYRVYVLSANDVSIDGGYDIQDWAMSETLPQEALDFIDLAESKGNVYSLNGFMNAYNIEETIGANDYVFITNNYVPVMGSFDDILN